MTPLGTMAWTACSAGWLVLGIVTGLPEAYATAIGCAGCAALWHLVQSLGD